MFLAEHAKYAKIAKKNNIFCFYPFSIIVITTPVLRSITKGKKDECELAVNLF